MELQTILITFLCFFIYWLAFKGCQFVINRSYRYGHSYESFDLWVTVLPVVNVLFFLYVMFINLIELFTKKEARKLVAKSIFKKLKK